MQILDGKDVAENIKNNFEQQISNLKIKPNIAVLGIKGDDASDVYIKRIEKNCEKYGIGFNLMMAETEEQFQANFAKIKNDEKITGIMFQQPLSKELSNLINEFPSKKDIEGVSHENMGKLFVGEKDAIAPCTSKAVIEVFDYYNIDLTGKKVVVVGRSNIVGKPLIPQLLQKNATVTICHSKTANLKEETKNADVVIMAIPQAAPMLLTRNLLYTGITRAKKLLIVIGSKKIVDFMVGNIDSKKRNTGLRYKLENYN